MSKFQRNLKRLGIGLGVVTAVGGISGLGWYQQHYVLPPEPKREIKLPSPNGFDTLQVAAKLGVKAKEGIAISPRPISSSMPFRYPIQPLAGRQKLAAANLASIRKTREVLTQEYCEPPIPFPGTNFPKISVARTQSKMLAFAAQTYADSGNLPEASRCALDAIELGTKVPRGGMLTSAMVGIACEAIGQDSAWKLCDRLDVKSARDAARRLETIEAERWPLANTLEEERGFSHRTMIRPMFAGGPKGAWETTGSFFGSVEQTTEEISEMAGMGGEPRQPTLREKLEALWIRAQVVYYGPKTVLQNYDRMMDEVIAQSKLPWGAPHPKIYEPTDPLNQLIAPIFGQLGLKWAETHAKVVLLKTYLALRAYRLEKGDDPDSLNALVTSGFLKAVPADPFSPTRAPLGYRRDSAEKFTLWSVGPDAKDDGGKPIAAKATEYIGGKSGDIVARINTK